MSITITQEYLTSRYSYIDGFLIYRFNKGNVKIGDKVGKSKDKDGYMRTSVYDKPQRVHRLIFLYHHGYLPEIVDHINGNILDNRIENLRESSAFLNGNNKEKHRKGIPNGISWHIRDKVWQCYKYVDKKRINLGYHYTFEEALQAIRIA